MTIPKYNEMYLDVLNILKDGEQYTRKNLAYIIADNLNLTEEERNIRISSGQPKYINRVGWTCTHLIKATLIESKKRGYVSITNDGLKILSNCPKNLNNKYFEEHYPSYYEFTHSNKTKIIVDDSTPEDKIKEAMDLINNTLASELLEAITNNEPYFFENLVVDLLLKMGYGGFDDNAGNVTPLSNDGGIDGIIKEDKLGFENIYIQAKRYTDQPVRRPEIQSFVGALNGNGANKGVFITTSTFTQQAQEFADSLNNMHIVLIDGELLTKLMIEYDLGVNTIKKYEIKQLDSDYFNR